MLQPFQAIWKLRNIPRQKHSRRLTGALKSFAPRADFPLQLQGWRRKKISPFCLLSSTQPIFQWQSTLASNTWSPQETVLNPQQFCHQISSIFLTWSNRYHLKAISCRHAHSGPHSRLPQWAQQPKKGLGPSRNTSLAQYVQWSPVNPPSFTLTDFPFHYQLVLFLSLTMWSLS